MWQVVLSALVLAASSLTAHEAHASAGDWRRILAWSLVGAVAPAGAVLAVVVIVHRGQRRHRNLPDGDMPPGPTP